MPPMPVLSHARRVLTNLGSTMHPDGYHGATGRSWYERHAAEDFHATTGRFDVTVGPNRFTAEGVTLDLPQSGLSGRVDFTTAFDPWPVTVRSPGIMGWHAWVPVMEAYHGVVSFGNGLAGSLSLGGARQDFDGGRGYLEKDWGRAFPSGYMTYARD